jgi:hypothetical protein
MITSHFEYCGVCVEDTRRYIWQNHELIALDIHSLSFLLLCVFFVIFVCRGDVLAVVVACTQSYTARRRQWVKQSGYSVMIHS